MCLLSRQLPTKIAGRDYVKRLGVALGQNGFVDEPQPSGTHIVIQAKELAALVSHFVIFPATTKAHT